MSRASPLAREAALTTGSAAVLAAVLAWTGPPGSDLAAHVYQRAVFVHHGFTFWNNFWYAGRYSFITYSVLYYPLAAELGIRLLAVATIATAALAFAVVLWREWGQASRWSSRTFAVVWAGIVLSAAFPFALGVALALLALWALQARRRWQFACLAALTMLASPVAFLLLLLIVVGIGIGRRADWRTRTTIGLALLTIGGAEALLWRAFPGRGSYPFSLPELAGALVFCALGTGLTWRVEPAQMLRWVFPVYGAACTASYLVPSAVGENISRLRFAAIPVAVLVLTLRRWRPRLVALVVLGLAMAWNLTPFAVSVVQGGSDPASNAAYWQPAIGFLHERLSPSYRVEAVDTAGHWAALYLPRAGIPLARGWFRQDDFPQNHGALREAPPPRLPLLAEDDERPLRRPDEGSARLQCPRGGGAPLRAELPATARVPDEGARDLRGARSGPDRHRPGQSTGALADRVADRHPGRPPRRLLGRRPLLAVLAPVGGLPLEAQGRPGPPRGATGRDGRAAIPGLCRPRDQRAHG